MIYPNLKAPRQTEAHIRTFGGIDKTPACPENCFSHAQNTSSRRYPLLTTRLPRLTLAHLDDSPSAIHTTNGITMTVGSRLYHNGILQLDGLEPVGKKHIVSMGGKNIIFPDGYYINTTDIDQNGLCTDRGYIYPKIYMSDGYIGLFPCVPEQPMPETGTKPPEEPLDGDYWLDTSVTPNKLMQYSYDADKWKIVRATHTCLYFVTGYKPFQVGAPIVISGTDSALDSGEHTVTLTKKNIIVVDKPISEYKVLYIDSTAPVHLYQPLPVMDMVCEQGNRIWGCRYGPNRNGKFVNEIYASALGDGGMFYKFEGLSTDSYAASIGSEGPFTGIISHMGYVVFFKENKLHRLFGTKPSNFTLYEDSFTGVKRGCEGSLCLCDGVVYYLGIDGFYAYTGSSPARISEELGDIKLTDAIAAFCKSTYTVCADGQDGKRCIYAYHTDRGTWHFHGYANLTVLASVDGNALGVHDAISDYRLCLLDSEDIPPRIVELYGKGAEKEAPIEWFAESPYLTVNTLDAKTLRRIQIRLETEADSRVTLLCKTDNDTQWEEWGTVTGRQFMSHTLYLSLPRCDKVKIRLEGRGGCTVHGLTKTFEYGGEVI